MKRFAIGVDLGGTNLRVAAVDDAGVLLDRISLATRSQQQREAVIREMCDSIVALRSKLPPAEQLVGIGVGVPGIIYVATGTLRQSPNLPGWENFPVRQELEQALGTRVLLDNDANVAALGELWLGAGRETSSLCMLTLGTGVGGGLIFDGKIWRGFLGFAGEVGHIVVAENGIPCPCGGAGCLETETSASAIVRKARQLLQDKKTPGLAQAISAGRELTAELVFETALAGDDSCREVLASVGRYLGIGLAGLVNSLNLPLYVIGGGAAAAWDLFSPAMFAELRRRSYIFCEGATRVEKAVLGGDAGLYGAARLAFLCESGPGELPEAG